MYREHKLSELKYSDLETEIKFEIAGARADGIQLLNLIIEDTNDGKTLPSVKRILKNMEKSKAIEFYVESSRLNESDTKVQFLYNKFNDYIKLDEKLPTIYIKL